MLQVHTNNNPGNSLSDDQLAKLKEEIRKEINEAAEKIKEEGNAIKTSLGDLDSDLQSKLSRVKSDLEGKLTENSLELIGVQSLDTFKRLRQISKKWITF